MKNVFVEPATRIRENSSGVKVKKRKLRVCAYCRVSTDSNEQQMSFDTQVSYYTTYINMNPEWEFAGVYADEGITGTSTLKRDDFNRMLDDSHQMKIDMIITKSVSRFARNTVDSLMTCRSLKKLGIGVYFEKESLNSLDEKGEMMLTIFSSIAQDESRSISENVKWGFRKRYKTGEVKMNTRHLLGFDTDSHGEVIIVEKEASIVRLIYDMYLEGIGTTLIARRLDEMKAETPKRAKKWNATTVLSILKNEKYIGDLMCQKTVTKDYLTRERVINDGHEPKYYIENHHQPIVCREKYTSVQEEIERRRQKMAPRMKYKRKTSRRRRSKYALSNIMVCGYCGHSCRRATWTNYYENRILYRCSNRLLNGPSACSESVSHEERRVIQKVSEMIQDNPYTFSTNELNDQIYRFVEKIIISNEEITVVFKNGKRSTVAI